MFKNVASQKVAVFAFDVTTGAAKTGDAANITVYVSKDWGAVTVLGDTTATEMSATNAPGWYLFDLTQAETNADDLLFTGKSSTANVSIVGRPIRTLPPLFTTLSVDANGRVDVIKLAGTTQTARDIGASVLLSNGTGAGQVKLASGEVSITATDIAAAGLSSSQQVWGSARATYPAAGTFGESFNAVVNGAAVAGTLSVTQMSTNLTEATTGHYIGRTVVWTTGALAGQASAVTAYNGATKVLTYDTTTDAPAAADRFVLV